MSTVHVVPPRDLAPLFLSPSPDDTVTAHQWAETGARGSTRLEWLEPDDPSRCPAGGVEPGDPSDDDRDA